MPPSLQHTIYLYIHHSPHPPGPPKRRPSPRSISFMARFQLTSSFLLLLLLLPLLSLLTFTEARPLHMAPVNGVPGRRFEGFSVGAVKHSGPSSRGGGHSIIRLGKLEVLVKDSGPSPGEGHKYITGNHH